jgi:hypothetical protein
MGLVADDDTKPAQDALRMCTNGESGGMYLLKEKK